MRVQGESTTHIFFPIYSRHRPSRLKSPRTGSGTICKKQHGQDGRMRHRSTCGMHPPALCLREGYRLEARSDVRVHRCDTTDEILTLRSEAVGGKTRRNYRSEDCDRHACVRRANNSSKVAVVSEIMTMQCLDGGNENWE